LSGNKINENAARYLSEALIKLTASFTLDLWYNFLNNNFQIYQNLIEII
jgi:hypothetical protein